MVYYIPKNGILYTLYMVYYIPYKWYIIGSMRCDTIKKLSAHIIKKFEDRKKIKTQIHKILYLTYSQDFVILILSFGPNQLRSFRFCFTI